MRAARKVVHLRRAFKHLFFGCPHTRGPVCEGFYLSLTYQTTGNMHFLVIEESSVTEQRAWTKWFKMVQKILKFACFRWSGVYNSGQKKRKEGEMELNLNYVIAFLIGMLLNAIYHNIKDD